MSAVVNIGSPVTGVVVNPRPASSIRFENKHLWPGLRPGFFFGAGEI
jgi:hypothetical protein